MTELTKPITRKTRRPFEFYRKKLVATLEPGDLISLRLERSRQVYRMDLHALYWKLVRAAAAARQLEEARAKKARKAQRRRWKK